MVSATGVVGVSCRIQFPPGSGGNTQQHRWQERPPMEMGIFWINRLRLPSFVSL